MDSIKELWPILMAVAGAGGVIAVLKHQAGQSERAATKLETTLKENHGEVMTRMGAQDERLRSIELHVERLDVQTEAHDNEIDRLRQKVSFAGLPHERKGNGK